MKIRTLIKSAFVSLRSNRLRSFLTMTGIIIGIGSVIIILSVGSSAQELITAQLKNIGSNLIIIFPGESEQDGPPVSALGITVTSFKNKDLKALSDQHRVSGVVAATGYVRGTGTVSAFGESSETTFLGVNAAYVEVESARVSQGRFFSDDEEEGNARVAVIGSTLKQSIFGDQDPLNQMIKIKKETFTVIGVFEPRGSVAFQTPDEYIYVPLSTAQHILLGIDYLTFARLKISDESLLDQAMSDVEATLREEHNLEDDEVNDFTVHTSTEALGVLTSITGAMKFFLALIASVSLIVGGIGIMNIMLVSVTERTREIGLRKALGAKRADIVRQFVLESSTLALVGGLAGMAIGLAISFVIALIVQSKGFDWQYIITLQSIILSTSFAVIVGLVFGIYPAVVASRLNPIESLRYE